MSYKFPSIAKVFNSTATTCHIGPVSAQLRGSGEEEMSQTSMPKVYNYLNSNLLNLVWRKEVKTVKLLFP